MGRDYMAIERAREAGRQPDYENTKDCTCLECQLIKELEEARSEISKLKAELKELKEQTL
jgi:hypothetical protein